MLPVLAGGVSAAESTRAGVSLVAIILFALAAGLAASAREYERGRALRRAGLWVAGTVLLPPPIGWVLLLALTFWARRQLRGQAAELFQGIRDKSLQKLG